MPGSFVIKSRHQTTFHFRRRVPLDLVSAIGKTHQVASLKTESRRQATVRARLLAAHFDALFSSIRMAKDTKKLEELIAQAKQKIEIDSVREYYENELIEQRLQFINAQKVERAAYKAGYDGALFEIRRKHAEEIDELKRQGVAPPPESTTSPPPPAPKPTTPSISQIWEAYKTEKIACKAWKDGENTAKYDHWPHVRTLIEIIGDKPIGEVTAADINGFLAHVLSDPDGGTPNNRAKRLTRAGAVFRWARGKRIIPDAFTELLRYPTKIEENPYVAFDESDLKALFESADYRNGNFKTPSEYWLPLLGLHTGARLNELCQLTVTDIGEHEGVRTLSILDDDENKRLKTTASRRIIPIHSNLIKCGFVDYAATIKEGRIFPELPEDPARPGNFGAKASELFTAYRRKQGVGEQESRSNKAFHSFRSTLISTLRKADVPGDRRRRLAGHEATDVHDRNYSGGDQLTMFNFKTLQADIEKAQFPISFYPYQPHTNKR